MKPMYSVIIPVYNEEAVIGETYNRLTKVMEGIGEAYELIFVNDGSRDASARIIHDLYVKDRRIKLLNFARNFGHQPAITAGMDYAAGSAVIVIDADLQDPPEIIPQMIEKWKEGWDVVYGKRQKRKGETAFKRVTAKLYYRFLRSMTNVDIPVDVGDFRLIDRKVCDAMKALPEKSRFVRGLVSWVGFRQAEVEYVREERFAGTTKYPLKKMIRFALDGITSFSYKPLKLATSLGVLISILSFIYLVVVFCQRIFTDTTITGWTSTIAVILFSQGIVMIMLGLMGEYIGRIYDEIKNRPIYIMRETIGFDKGEGVHEGNGSEDME